MEGQSERKTRRATAEVGGPSLRPVAARSHSVKSTFRSRKETTLVTTQFPIGFARDAEARRMDAFIVQGV
jgi:hypothetical protein